MLKVIYGTLQAALLWYNKFRQELEKEGFEFNPYDPCVGNRMKNGFRAEIMGLLAKRREDSRRIFILIFGSQTRLKIQDSR